MRLLSDALLARWAARLETAAAMAATARPSDGGPSNSVSVSASDSRASTALVRRPPVCLVMWGTDWETQPLQNDAALAARLPALWTSWQQRRAEALSRSGLGAFFRKVTPESMASATSAVATTTTGPAAAGAGEREASERGCGDAGNAENAAAALTPPIDLSADSPPPAKRSAAIIGRARAGPAKGSPGRKRSPAKRARSPGQMALTAMFCAPKRAAHPGSG